MIQSAILNGSVQCKAAPDRGGAMIYYKDAARAARDLLAAPTESIKMINYNVGGIQRVTPREIEGALKKNLPAVTVNYVPSPGGAPPMREIVWNDSYARSEWGWSPTYADIDRLVSDFVHEIRTNPHRHGVK